MPSLSELLNSKKTVFIGSSPEADIVVDETAVSPMHCQVSKVQSGVYRIVDLESAAGTFLNGQKIIKAVAGDEDELRVGSRLFALKSEAQNTAAQGDYGFYQHTTASASIKNKITVYFLAAPQDEATCEAVYRHLSTVRFSSPMPVEILGDFKMAGGEDIASYRQKAAAADIVLAFVSVDFLNDNDCYARLKTVIDNHNNRKAILLPILVRNCLWKNTPFANLPLLPRNQQPLNNKQYWNSEDDALTNVVNDIYQSISTITQNSTPQAPLAVTETAALKTNWRGQYLWRTFWKRTAAYLLDVLIVICGIL